MHMPKLIHTHIFKFVFTERGTKLLQWKKEIFQGRVLGQLNTVGGMDLGP